MQEEQEEHEQQEEQQEKHEEQEEEQANHAVKMFTLFHYTDSEGLRKIVETQMLQKHNGSGLTDHDEGVFFTTKAPDKKTRLEILQNNYHHFGWKKHKAKASWFIRVIVDANQRDKFCKRSLQDRDVWVFNGDLDLNDQNLLMKCIN